MNIEELFTSIRHSWSPPPRLTLSEWADRYAVLSAESSAEVGRWKTIPYQRGMLDACTDRAIERVTIIKSARVGYTKMLNHLIGYHMHYDPCPIMVAQPTIGDAEGWSKDELAPMLRDTPVLEGLVADTSKRDSGNTILHKQFPGGQIRIVGADSPRGFRRVTMRVLLLDEVDGYSASAGEEGDQIKLAERRTDTFWNRKIVAGSTPTLDQTSRIKRLFELSDQRHYFVPCPECKKTQVLRWERMKWESKQPETVRYICEHCEAPIEYRWQRWMVEEADRLQRAGDPTAGWVARRQDIKGHAGFHIWAAYSYSPNATWPHLVREWLDCYKNIEQRKVFCNTVLGEAYKGEGDAPEWKRIYDRREPYAINTVPVGGLVLVAGADVQKDRIEVEIVAYGRNMRSWSVDYRVFPGDTSVIDGPGSPWNGLAELLNESWRHPYGGELRVRLLGVDSSYQTNAVYNWVRRWPVNRVLALDGRDSYQMIIGQPKAVEVTERGKRKSKSVKLWPVGVSLIKTELYGWLKQDRPTAESGNEFPFGYCHHPEYPEEYFKQLTAEEIVPRLVKGFRRYQWEKVRERNEALDCRVYARACTGLLGIDRWKDEQWLAIEEELGLINDGPKNTNAQPLFLKPKSSRADDPYL